MDPRSPYLHQSNHRYASQPHLQPHPRPHNNFHAGTNIHTSHHSSLPSGSPLPLRPPPPPPNQFHLPPAQPQLNPQNSSFPFNSNNINYNHHRTHPDVPNFSQPPRVLHQKSLENELSRRLQDNFREIHVDSRESSRVSSDRWPTERPYSSSNLNQESYRRQLVNQTMPPMKIRQGLEGNSRLVEERNVIMSRQEEEFLMRRGDDNYPRRIQFGSISERSSRDSRTVSNQMNHGSSYDSLRNLQYDDRGCENQRRAHDRVVIADLRDSFIGMGSHERGAHERMQISGKYENHRSREELERHAGKGSIEGSFECNRTPRKQPQKRSALLRLQKPNNRNREEAKAQYYFDDSKSTSFRVKDQNLYPDRGMEQLVREGSPVELDVSFKSNSLVAKAIVTPSSSVAVSDPDSTPKNGKIRKVLFHNKDSSSSLIKSDEQTAKLENAISVANNTSSSDTSLIQAKEEGTTSVIGNLHKNTSVPASSGTKVLPGKSKMESSSKGMISKKDGTNVASTKTSSVKVTKKKKIVKRVVKKVLHHNLTSSSSQPTKKCDDTVILDSVSHGLPDSSELENDVTIASASAVDSQLCSNGIMLVPENDKVEQICDLAASENVADACSSRLCVPNIKRKRSHSTSPMGSSSREETQINENKLNANSADFMCAISDTNTDDKWLKEKFSPDVDDIEDVNKKHYEHEDSVLLENNKASSSLNMLLPSKSNAGIVISSVEKIEILEGQPSSYNTLGHDTSHGLISSREGVTVSEYGLMVVGCKQHCTDQDGPSVENANIDEISNASCSRGNSKRFKPSDLEDATIQRVAKHPICSQDGVKTMSDSDNCHGLSEERICFSHGVTYINQPSPERVSFSVDDVSASGSLNFMVSAGVNEEDTSNNKMSEENVDSSQVNLLKSEVNKSYLDPVNVVHRACWVDTTLRLSFKECIGCSGNAGVQHCRDVFSGFPRESSIDVSEDFIASPKQKQRKLSGSQLNFSWTTKSDGNESPIIAVSSSGGSQTVQEDGARESTLDPLNISDFPHSEKDNIGSLANCSGGECYSTVASIREASDDDDPKGLHLCSTKEELAVPKVQSLYPPGLEVEQIVDGGTVLAGSTHQINSIYLGSAEGEKMDVDAAEGKLFIDNGNGQCEVPSKIQSLGSDERLLAAHVENQNFHKVKNDSSSLSKYLSSPIDGNVVSVTNSSINILELVPDTLLDTKYVDSLRDVTSTLDTQLSIDKVATDDEILGQSGFHGGSNMSPLTSDPLIPDTSINSDHAAGNAHLFSGKTGTLPQMDMKNSSPTLNSSSGERLRRKNQPNQALSRTLGSSSVAFAASRKVASSAYPSKRRTWHRTDNVSTSTPAGHKAVTTTVLKQKQLSKNVSKSQSSSYIRKGNSLVRKPIVLAAQSLGSDCLSHIGQLNSLGILDELKKNIGSDHRTLSAELPNFGRKTVNVSFETPRTPPLPTANITPNHSSGSLEIHMASPATDFVNNYATESSPAPVNAAESNDVIKSSEDAIKGSENQTREIGQINNFDCQNELNEGNPGPSNGNIITYVKPKSNQLIATSNPHVSVNNSNNTSSTPSDGYYKRRKNQLIRTSLKSQVERLANLHDESVNSEEQDLLNCASSKNFAKTEFLKVVTKTRKPSKLSLVWTLHSSQLSNGNGNLLHRQKVWPHLFPWKRATYLKSFVPNAAASLISSSSSTMRKLLLLRKRDTVYTRSIHGFSLRKSKVLSVGGSSLKWSKSIERQSKKANEEATLAVAEAERKKREQSGASHFVSGTKNNSPHKLVHNMKLHRGERIFQIGSARYKMDSSRRILQRVSDDDSSYPAVRQTETDAKISYIPRRLVIGKDEYVRIGNGNQLVRDPKRRTRILASEKVRWSLHTARSRLARKRKYCQFFTRFGKCNKGDGKCHYIHDSSKIAVCTKFLKGLCFDEDCKLTHKVIPERMPDCSYFLQDICSNKNCPYRHVHVNPNASTCEGFLRGYCADGDECRKKHSYVCPAYEAMGCCPQGSKCKLHHPKNRSKGKKCKQLREKKNGQGRYFGSIYKNVFEPGTKVSGKRPLQDNGDSNLEGSNAEYISLDFSDEAGETSNPLDEELYFSDSNSIDLQLVGLEDQIKPIRIMNG